MKISVVIPYYHGQRYMAELCRMLRENRECLPSEYEMEVVLVNDSPEEDLYLEADMPMPVKIIKNHKNSGIHKTRVNGMQQSTGDYILFLDQDDRIEPDCLKSQAEHIGDADFCVCAGTWQLQNGERRPFYRSEKMLKGSLDLRIHYGYENIIVSPGQVLLKKSAVPQEWKEYAFQKNGADDHYLWLLMLEEGKKGAVNSECLYTHVATGSNTSMDGAEMCASKLELVERMRKRTSGKNCRLLTRRALYYANDAQKITTKIRFLDVILRRKWLLYTAL